MATAVPTPKPAAPPKFVHGTPIQIPVELQPTIRRYTDALSPADPTEAIFEGYQACLTPGMTYVKMLVKDNESFKKAIVPVLVKPFALKKMSRAAGKALQEHYEKYKFENIGVVTSGMGNGYMGTDPEIFVKDENGEVIPAWLFLGDKKDNLLTTSGTNFRSAAFWDGFQAEYAVRASFCLGFVTDAIRDGLLKVYRAAIAYNPKARLSLASVAEVPMKYLREGEDKHIMFGCMPSKNVYDKQGEHAGNGRDLPIRFAGGHIHGGRQADSKAKERMIRAMDALLGVPCVSMFAEYDNPVRRQFYGLAGEWREPAHGLEYRTLSNAWLTHPAITHFVFELARKAMQFGQADLNGLIKGDDKDIQRIINTCDVQAAKEFVATNHALFNKLLECMYSGAGGSRAGESKVGAAGCAKWGFHLIENGINSVIEEPKNLAKNWALDGNWVEHSENAGAQWRRAAEILQTGKKL
jgi:hypothetical protein